ncbi:hypothetical protein GMA10_03065 [Kocuria koreensis]|jgi:hypothetical protein|uniref:Uncharacterized protein n=1 Tax=Rothia koreensis TaxID=592378 RepID=A0A7K1LG87_9MICC|nr:hypothetical protein [Rothia koreensis]MUN54205.1 hypothetical protein [Rothia koreensis]
MDPELDKALAEIRQELEALHQKVDRLLQQQPPIPPDEPFPAHQPPAAPPSADPSQPTMDNADKTTSAPPTV